MTIGTFRIVVLRLLIVAWVSFGCLAFAQSVPTSTQLFVEREIAAQASVTTAQLAANTSDISALYRKVDVVEQTANSARDDVKEIRTAVWACAGTVLISLFLQVAEAKRRRREP